MKKAIMILCISLSFVHAEWVMFADKNDTYLYNNQTGEVYIKHKQGAENYKDIWVRMPSGVIPNNGGLKQPATPPKSSLNMNTVDQDSAKKLAQEAMKQVGNLLYQGGE